MGEFIWLNKQQTSIHNLPSNKHESQEKQLLISTFLLLSW